ncbi:MAG: hypothetical protein H6R13_1135 [Proteobacteria bacterium]|nr:hypothetical protein [Pseudomonadota bacterium]
MDPNLVYAKTPTGDEAVRQSTRVVQRNLRMVLVQVDGKTSVEELAGKIGNPRLVESALRELEEGGYIAPTIEAVSVWEESKKAAKAEPLLQASQPMSQFSVFGPKSQGATDSKAEPTLGSGFSSFGKPILPAANRANSEAVKRTSEVAPKEEPEYSSPRRSLLTWRLAALGLAGLFATLAGMLLVFPYERFKPAIETSLAQYLDAPVRVEGVGITLFPMPQLKLTGVHIGTPTDSRIAEIRISSPLSLLGSSPFQISRVDVTGAALSANRLVAMPLFKSGAAGNSIAIIRKIHLDHSQLVLSDDLAFAEIYGEILFKADGVVEKATFETNDRSLLVDVQPSPLGVAMNIEGRAWKPSGTTISFASLQAKGVLQKDRLLVQNLDTTFLGGILKGNWLLDWSNGLAMAGDGTLSRIDGRKLAAALVPSLKIEGDMSGSVRVRSTGRDWNSLWGNSEATLNTEITRGVLYGVDLGEAARRNGVSDVRAGATKFDRLRSNITITPKQVAGRDVRMDAGMVTAVGQFVSSRDGLVEGNMAVTLQTSVSTVHAPVRVFGTLPDLSATTRK